MRQVVCWYPVVASVLVPLITFYSLYTLLLRDYGRGKHFLAPPPSQISSSEGERTNIFFLKVHKCASSTVQNILLRFGLERQLTFVLPSVNNYIGNPATFTADMIDDKLATPSNKYHIFAHHTRYSNEVPFVMYNDTVYVTILRQPADVYESIYSYYKLHKMFNVTFQELLKTPSNVMKINRRFMKRIGFNQMSYDLGFLEEDFNSTTKVGEFIDKIDEGFDLVMMSEWMEASLVLLANIMNWPLENVVSLKLNSRSAGSVYVMSDIERKRVAELNSIDYKLYTYFLKRFRAKVRDYGEQKMKTDIEKLMTLNSKLQFRCVKSLNNKGFANTQAYELRNESDRLCHFAALGELVFTEQLRVIQTEKLRVINKLESLLNDDDVI